MLVSVVIPAYNEEKYLAKTLASLTSQNHPNFDFEIIVANAESTDKTAEIAKNYSVKVIKVPKINPATARQKGIEASQGDIIACVDADTLVPSGHLQTIVDEFNRDPKTVGLTGIIEGWGGPFWQNFIYKWINTIFCKFNFILGAYGFQGQSFAFRKSAFLKIGGFNTQLHTGEDFDLGQRMSKVGSIKLIPKTFGISSIRRIKEGPIKTISRGFLSYLKVVWKIPIKRKLEKESFPAIR
ncbi:MAG: glycosyltransferase [Candidatus Gottesmanbacteria bacterium]